MLRSPVSPRLCRRVQRQRREDHQLLQRRPHLEDGTGRTMSGGDLQEQEMRSLQRVRRHEQGIQGL